MIRRPCGAESSVAARERTSRMRAVGGLRREEPSALDDGSERQAIQRRADWVGARQPPNQQLAVLETDIRAEETPFRAEATTVKTSDSSIPIVASGPFPIFTGSFENRVDYLG